VTLPAHCSMWSGVLPAVHGVTWNDARGSGGLGVPTAFTIAKQAGLRTAAFVAKDKLSILWEAGGVDTAQVVRGDALQVAAAAAAHIVQAQPNLCFIHFADVDGAGHDSGWGSSEQRNAMARCDRAVGLLLGAVQAANLSGTSVMILTADHGGHGKGHGSDVPSDRTIPWICAGRGVATRREITSPVHVCDTAAMALYALGLQPPATWYGKVIPGVFPTPRGVGQAPWRDGGQRTCSIASLG